ncbi:MAG: sigma-54 dependent transcriptional regulator [Deltaproteobacteria bacterium]|nr:sigma-54 dependent transcriptional regulator [Deltaproteobacteria bacterium]
MKQSMLIVEDEETMRKTLSEVFVRRDFRVLTAERAGSALEIFKSQKVDIALLDVRLPDRSGLDVLKELRSFDDDTTVIVMTAYPDVKTAILAMKEGAYDYINKPFELDELKLLVDKATENRQLKSEVELRRYERKDLGAPDMVGESPAFELVREFIQIVSGTPKTSVLIMGETGTGKELVANSIHCNSERRDNAYIKINCSAIPENLLESELFGYEKGAFTDARQSKKGLFELADGGTIFLDEMGEMDINLQSKLLQVLEYQTFRKLGGTRDISVDVRVIAATNRNLERMVKKNEFREDLYYRLKVMVVELPPLRERRKDVHFLAEYFIDLNNPVFGKNIKGISRAAKDMILNYSWPGNIRELKNVMERAVILAKGETIDIDSLPRELLSAGENALAAPQGESHEMTLEDVEKYHIIKVHKMLGGNKTKAAKLLGISRLTLRDKLKKYGLHK